jgi:hypothetical protein
MWVGGNAVVIQNPGGDGTVPDFTPGQQMEQVYDAGLGRKVPWTDIVGYRQGPFSRFRGRPGQFAWFHFAVPTPAVVPQLSESRHLYATVDFVSVYFRTVDMDDGEPTYDVRITDVNVFNAGGNGHIALPLMDQSGRPGLYGDHLTEPDSFNGFSLGQPIALSPTKSREIGISVRVAFDVDGEVTFRGAGIHYFIG